MVSLWSSRLEGSQAHSSWARCKTSNLATTAPHPKFSLYLSMKACKLLDWIKYEIILNNQQKCNYQFHLKILAQSAGAVEFAVCISAKD